MSEITSELRNAFLQIARYKNILQQRNIGIVNVRYLLYFSEELREAGALSGKREETEREENTGRQKKRVRWEEAPPIIHPIKPHGKNRRYRRHHKQPRQQSTVDKVWANIKWDEAYGTTSGSNGKSGIEKLVDQPSEKFESQNPPEFPNLPTISQTIVQENADSSPLSQIASSSRYHIEDCNIEESNIRSTLEFEFQEDEEAECLKKLQEDLAQGRQTRRSWRI